MNLSHIKAWIPAIIWALGIFYLSSIPLKLGAPSTSQIPDPVQIGPFSQIAPEKPLPGSDTVQSAASSTFPFNELFHVFEFGGLYFWIAFALQHPKIKIIPLITRKRTFVALTISIIYLFLDETHQILVPGRNFEFVDIILDFLGIFIMLTVLKLIEHKFPKGLNQVNTFLHR